VEALVLRRINEASSLYQMYGVFGDVIARAPVGLHKLNSVC
jgi:hypothetical protein